MKHKVWPGDYRPALRACLKCGTTIKSVGWGHRLCAKCRQDNEQLLRVHLPEALGVKD